MTKSKQPDSNSSNETNKPPNLVTRTLALVVTPAMRAAIERKRLKRQKARFLGEDLHAGECGDEIDLGDFDKNND